MPSTDQIIVALKEWAVVVDALRTGRQIILLRKGGIIEKWGKFEIDHREFVFFPTFLHQDYKMLKPEVHARFQPQAAEPERVMIDTVGQITDILQLADRKQMNALAAEHVWTDELIDMRFSYKPASPLYLLIVR